MFRLQFSTVLFWLFSLSLLCTCIQHCRIEKRLAPVFAEIDKRLRLDRVEIEKINALMQKGIASVPEVYPGEKNRHYANVAIEQIRLCEAYCNFLDSVKLQLIAAAGGPSESDPMLPNDLHNCEAVSRVLLKSISGRLPLLDEIGQRTRVLRRAIAENMMRGPDSIHIPLTFNYFEENAGLERLGAAGMLAMLSNLQVKAKISVHMGLNRVFEEMARGGEIRFFDVFQPMVISPTCGFVVPDENYEADILLSSYSDRLYSASLKVNGIELPLKEGLGHFETYPRHPGRNTFTVEATVATVYFSRWDAKLKIDTTRFSRTFSYYVARQPFAQIHPKQGQFLYAGIANPLHIEAPGIEFDSMKVTAANMQLHSLGNGRYLAKPDKPGKAIMTIHTPWEPPAVFTWTVRPLPAPVLTLGDSLRNGRIALQALAGQTALIAYYPEDYDFQADCRILGFRLTRYRQREDPLEAVNTGHHFSMEILQLLANSQPGDRLIFEDIQVQIAGEQIPRQAGTLSFMVKE